MKFEGTFGIPNLEFIENKGIIKIYGNSFGFAAKENFWDPLIKKIDTYLDNPRDIVITIDLEFFSTITYKSMLEMFKLVEKKTEKTKKKFKIEWVYEDEELFEAGMDYKTMFPEINFEFVKK